MLNGTDLENMGYYDMFQEDGTPKNSFAEYSQWVEGKMLTKGLDRQIENTLGLVGEAGEVAEKIKKVIRDQSRFTQEDILKELGDVLFYTAALANFYGGTLQRVAEMNMEKLDKRQREGKLQGSGDNR